MMSRCRCIFCSHGEVTLVTLDLGRRQVGVGCKGGPPSLPVCGMCPLTSLDIPGSFLMFYGILLILLGFGRILSCFFGVDLVAILDVFRVVACSGLLPLALSTGCAMRTSCHVQVHWFLFLLKCLLCRNIRCQCIQLYVTFKIYICMLWLLMLRPGAIWIHLGPLGRTTCPGGVLSDSSYPRI
jgi:hypothetical protein